MAKIKLPGNCMTTAMGIMPHKEIEPAMKLALSLDIPFWPQLPKFSYYEDMYVQVSENFPGIIVDEKNQRITLDMDGFMNDLPLYLDESQDEAYFHLTGKYSQTFDTFLAQDLTKYKMIRGQNIGPISFGLKIVDKDKKPIIYNDEVRGFLYEFIAQKVNAQYRQLKAKNENTFVWLDEPGLQILFGPFTGYSSDSAKKDFAEFLDGVEGPRGVHLCGNPDWSFLISGLGLDILSMDAYSWGHVFTRYRDEVAAFLKEGGIISWGLVPTLTEELSQENIQKLAGKLEGFWDYLVSSGVDKELILDRSWIAPSRCCLVNADGTKSVDQSFKILREVGYYFQEKYKLY
ncbi:hypothetical protein NVS47_08070 [Dehalobacterium formicoaceticum]|uniref:Methionine synthase n=1 Tax=Dehalobacterium formicoaceticum TaxID=51515 RepID=A0ABT1Y3M1_9FIRM|nr:hypothetical protein [Dehalobacterium formicoaceticum]MCR6545472.1 hypothetical protein [Dehalobacterium formicoaceticum]